MCGDASSSPVCSRVRRKGPKRECPDYVTAGPNSCHFDSSHTTVWNVYCMTVTAVTAARNYTSQQHCLDVADIGENVTGSPFPRRRTPPARWPFLNVTTDDNWR